MLSFRYHTFFSPIQVRVQVLRIALENQQNKSQKHKIGYWTNEENISKFLTQLKQNLNLETVQDWNSINKKQIQKNGGSALLQKYSLYEIKCKGYPEGKSQFTPSRKPIGYWEDKNNILNFLSKLKEKYSLKTPNDWNLITQKEIRLLGGSRLLQKLSIFDIKCLGCPEGKLFFEKKPNPYKPIGFWYNKNNILNFLHELKIKYNFKSPEDWNLLTAKQIQLHGGSRLLHIYSLYELKCLACSDCDFQFDPAPKSSGFWDNKENILKFLDFLKKKFNLQSPEDWNLLNAKQIQSNGGSRLLFKYSLFEIKCLGCPEGVFMYDKPVQSRSLGFWDKKENITLFLDELKEKLNLQTTQDWKRLSKYQIQYHGGHQLTCKYPIHEIIQFHDPNIKFSNNFKRSNQRWLFLQVQKLFPGEEIVEDYFHSEISRKTGFPVQFDIFLIHKKTAIEYHGKQHYEDIPSKFSPIELYKNRDNEKIKLCKEFGIQLIIIPYWWDNNFHSLQSTLLTKL